MTIRVGAKPFPRRVAQTTDELTVFHVTDKLDFHPAGMPGDIRRNPHEGRCIALQRFQRGSEPAPVCFAQAGAYASTEHQLLIHVGADEQGRHVVSVDADTG